MKTVYVRFWRASSDLDQDITVPVGAEYAYLYAGTKKVEHKSIAVVKARNRYTCVYVTRVTEDRDPNATKHLVDVVDTAGYADLVEKEVRRAELMKMLETKAVEIHARQHYEILAAMDTTGEMKSMVDELYELDGVLNQSLAKAIS